MSKNITGETSAAVQLPSTAVDLMRQRRTLKKQLLQHSSFTPARIAILGGSTTVEVKNMLELFLLARGILPSFYESGYNRYAEDVLFENPALWSFRPDIVLIHTTWQNVLETPELLEDPAETDRRVSREVSRFQVLWEKIHDRLGAVIIQNNFDLPRLRPLGNLDAVQSCGRANILLRLNAEIASYARSHSRFLVNDILYLSAEVGLHAWFDQSYWYSFHMALSPTGTVALARNVAGIIQALYGKSKKCLVLDLDNTLWGGTIGDDGMQNIVLGKDHALGEAFLDFQRYVKDLRRRGILLAVCSKNEIESAKQGFSHPDSVLKLEDFSAFKANWNPKPGNIQEIARELSIGLDSLVFVDDNPAERALMAAQLPEVGVPDVGSDVSLFAEALERERYFEVGNIVREDLERSTFYGSNAQRTTFQNTFADYGDFLASLEMAAEIAPFSPVYLDRITQLINKTNQFNVTTRRYTTAEVMELCQNPSCITLYGRLADRFGDNGLVSVIVAWVVGDVADIDIWLMSCRVLKRDFELAMFDALVGECGERGIRQITGVYVPSKKNNIVAGLYASLGFVRADDTPEGAERWRFDVPKIYAPRNRYIRWTADMLAVAG